MSKQLKPKKTRLTIRAGTEYTGSALIGITPLTLLALGTLYAHPAAHAGAALVTGTRAAVSLLLEDALDGAGGGRGVAAAALLLGEGAALLLLTLAAQPALVVAPAVQLDAHVLGRHESVVYLGH